MRTPRPSRCAGLAGTAAAAALSAVGPLAQAAPAPSPADAHATSYRWRNAVILATNGCGIQHGDPA